MTNELPDLVLYKFLFNFEFLEDATLPEFKGSTIRGAFGWSLFKAIDNLYPIYQHIFETEGDEYNIEYLKGVKKIPHPFILHPPLATKRDFVKGEIITIGITLIGYAHNFLPFIVEAFKIMGEEGITSKRKKLKLLNVFNEDFNGAKIIIYRAGSQELKNNYRAILLKEILLNINYNTTEIKLNFETPLEIQYQSQKITEHYINVLTPAIIAANIERRYKALAKQYCKATPVIDEIFQPHTSVKILKNRLQNFSLLRQSYKETEIQRFYGLAGSFVLKGNLKSILPVLHIGQFINMGKKTSFGWGQYKINSIE